MVLFLTLAILLIISGLGLIYYAGIARPTQLQVQATTTVQAIQTSNAHTVGTANAQTTGTVQAYSKASATAIAQATTAAQATVTAEQTLYTTSTRGQPAFSSPLTHQDAGLWDIYNAVGGGGCAFTGGALHASIAQKNFYVACFAHGTNAQNFALEVSMTILKGDEGGVIFRGNDAASQFYYFRVGRDGLYSLIVAKDNTHNTPLAYDSSKAIKTGAGQTNLLTIVAKGSSIYLYINKQFVTSVNDATYNSGEIGILAGDNTNDTDVAFTNANIWVI